MVRKNKTSVAVHLLAIPMLLILETRPKEKDLCQMDRTYTKSDKENARISKCVFHLFLVKGFFRHFKGLCLAGNRSIKIRTATLARPPAHKVSLACSSPVYDENSLFWRIFDIPVTFVLLLARKYLTDGYNSNSLSPLNIMRDVFH
jgi:hypothetical protein